MEVKEAVLWAGAIRAGRRPTATLLPAGDQLDERGTAAGRGAAGTAARAGRRGRPRAPGRTGPAVDGWLLDATIAYVPRTTGPHPLGRWYEVLEVLPFVLKRLREVLRALDAGPLVVKKRGTAVEPEVLRRQLGLRGSREVTVVLARSCRAGRSRWWCAGGETSRRVPALRRGRRSPAS